MSIFQVVLKGNQGNSSAYRNVHHYEFPGYVPDETELQEFIDNLDDALFETIRGAFSSQWTSDGYDVRRVDIGDQPTIPYVSANQPYAGLSTDNLLPRQTALLVRWRAATEYPRNCRTYLGGFTEGNNATNGVVEASLIPALETWALAMEAIEVTGQTDANKVAVQYGGDPRAVVASNTVSFLSVAGTWRTQKRRVPGVGI